MYLFLPLVALAPLYLWHQVWRGRGVVESPTCPYEIRDTPTNLVGQAHSSLHFQRTITLVASRAAGDPVGLRYNDATQWAGNQTLVCAAPLRAWQLQGFSLANIIVLELDDQWILIDAGETTETTYSSLAHLSKILRLAGCVHERPIKYVLLSHHHTDHTGGVSGAVKWNSLLSDADPGPGTATEDLEGVEEIVQSMKHTDFHDTFIDRRRLIEAATTHMPTVLAHQLTYEAMLEFYSSTVRTKFKRAVKQFGSGVVRSENRNIPVSISAGIGRSYKLEWNDPPSAIFPSHVWSGNKLVLRFPNLSIELLLMPGETSDQVCLFVPELALFHMSDNFYFSFPNVYPLRGSPPRSPMVWQNSLDKFLQEYWQRTAVITVGHTSPVFGQGPIRYIVERYRDALAFIQHQTMRLLDQSSDVNLIADQVSSLFWTSFPVFDMEKLSTDFMNSDITENMVTDPLMPYYGQLDWAVKAFAFSQIGWFTEDPTLLNLHRLTSADRARKLGQLLTLVGQKAEAGNMNQLLATAITRYLDNGECQWALELTEMLGSTAERFPQHLTVTAGHPCKPSAAPAKDIGDIKTLLLGDANYLAVPTETTDSELRGMNDDSASLFDEAMESADRISQGDLEDSVYTIYQFITHRKTEEAVVVDASQMDANLLRKVQELESEYNNSEIVETTEAPQARTDRSALSMHMQKLQQMEEIIKQQWEQAHCPSVTASEAETDIFAGTSPMDVPAHTVLEKASYSCLRKRALWCLADQEISASGRNWYLSEAANTDTHEEHQAFVKMMRKMVLKELPNLDFVITKLGYRFVPFGDRRRPRDPVVFYITVIGQGSTGMSNVDEKPWRENVTPVLSLEDTNITTYQVVFRNQVFNVRKIIDPLNDIDWYAVKNYASFDMVMKWSGIKAMFQGQVSAPQLLLSRVIPLPTQYPLPVVALKTASTNPQLKSKVREVLGQKRKLSITNRMQMLLQFAQLMLSLEQH